MTESSPLFTRSFVSAETYDAFFSVIGRLEQTIEGEMAVLANGRHAELADISRQKRQGFLELNRIMRGMEQTIPSQDIIARLSEFRRKIAANSAALSTHLKAAQEVTGLIMRVMHDAESDGTYTSTLGHAGYDFA